tara:strand:- start:858 stop:1214 length:357 start_codon:yes stop_codon:yes gene_type:complete
MVKLNDLGLGILFFTIGHILVWFQLNGQFKWEWFKNNEFIVASSGLIISIFYIWGTKYTVQSFDGLLWPARFVGFAIGIVIYAIFVELFFKEGINTKTFISLILSFVLICIQVLWKIK